MFNLKSLIKADKYFQIDLQKYGEALKWYKEVEEIDLSDDENEICKENRKRLVVLAELEEEIEMAEVNWLKSNKERLLFDIQPEDKEFAFVDVLTIYLDDWKECNKVYEQWFYGDGEAQEFKDMIYS